MLYALGLSACAKAPEHTPKMATVDGVSYRLFYAESVLDPVAPVVEMGRDGRILPPSGVDPMPWIYGWVVQRSDGKPITSVDGVAAAKVFTQSCPASTEAGRLIGNGGDPVWFFGECAS
ncbi:MAG: hypothetical protein Q4G26_16580 [Paracoccus sp. (in: a-proteobacteria)]|nr:hypothetical protein [Paracoccus sp. (in: a-proteobacteria)]